jgi:deazaflavin-dependent oxidoreductase (nitroreductase family)
MPISLHPCENETLSMKQSVQDIHQKFLDGIRIFNKHIFNRITLKFTQKGKGPFSILRHIGRKSGRIYQTPVLASYIGDIVIVPLSYGENADWLLNVKARGGCEIHWRDKWVRAENPMVIDSKEAFNILPEQRIKLFERFKMDKFLRLQIFASNGNNG